MHEVLLVGCGNIAGGFDDAVRSVDALPLSHVGAYRCHGGFRIAACVEPDREKRAAFMARWGIDTGFSGVAEVPPGRYDVASICSPTMCHLDDVTAAIALGARVIFCEKPLAPTLADAEELVRRCAVAGVPLVVNHSRRWDDRSCRLAKEIAAGAWGRVRAVNGLYTKGILNNGSHMIDLLRMLFGELDLRAAGSPVFDGYPGDPSVAAMLETATGVPILLNRGDARDYTVFELQIVAESCVLVMEDGGFSWRVRDVVESPVFRGYRNLAAGKVSPGGLAGAMLGAVTEVGEVLRGTRQLSSTGESALAAQRLCEQIRTLALASSFSLEVDDVHG